MSKASFYDGVEEIWNEYWHGSRSAADALQEMYARMQKNADMNRKWSDKNWRMECQLDIAPHNESKEKCLEKSVAFLGERGHMRGWCNQVPTASGVAGSGDRQANVDLAHWDEENKHLRLVELKWESSDPVGRAMFQAIKSGLAYIFFCKHRGSGKWKLVHLRPRHVALEVVAPREFFALEASRPDALPEISQALVQIASGEIADAAPEMSVGMHAFPEDFRLPFANGAEVKVQCNTTAATPEGRRVRDAFANLSPVWK